LFNIPFYYNINFNGKDYAKSEDITLTSNDELLEEFKAIVKPLYEKDNLHNHLKLTTKILPYDGANRYLELNPNNNWFCVKIPLIRGDYNDKGQKLNQYMTLFTNNYLKTDICLYSEMFNPNIHQLYFGFNTLNEASNFYNYCQTDFARICLLFSKTTLTLGKGELKTISWFDFSDPIFSKSPSEIDDYLFEKYGISNKIRKHVESILPDYYSIRK